MPALVRTAVLTPIVARWGVDDAGLKGDAFATAGLDVAEVAVVEVELWLDDPQPVTTKPTSSIPKR